jgi:hypothetical protein
MSQAATVEPLAQGSLADTPLGHLLVYFEQRRSNGTLVLSPASAERDGLRYGMRVRDGRVVGALIGADAQGLEHALLPLCALTDGIFAFYADDLLPSDDSLLVGNLDPYRFLSASLTQYARDDLVDRVLERYAGVRMRLQPRRELERLRLDEEQRVLLDVLRASPATPEELSADAPMPTQKARRTVYLLIVTRTIEPFQENATQGRPNSRLLSVPLGPDASASSTSTSAVRRKSSIPSMPIPAMGEVRTSQSPPAPSMPSKPPAAWKVLAARRATSIAPGAPVDAGAVELKRIEKLVRASDLIAAERAIDALLGENRSDPRTLATRAWILLLKATKARTKVPREVMELSKRALAENPDEARALLTKGLYFKHEDKLQQALVCFRKAVRADPMDIDAKREAHLLSRQLGVPD